MPETYNLKRKSKDKEAIVQNPIPISKPNANIKIPPYRVVSEDFKPSAGFKPLIRKNKKNKQKE